MARDLQLCCAIPLAFYAPVLEANDNHDEACRLMEFVGDLTEIGNLGGQCPHYCVTMSCSFSRFIIGAMDELEMKALKTFVKFTHH
jgi:hypothetical protein